METKKESTKTTNCNGNIVKFSTEIWDWRKMTAVIACVNCFTKDPCE